MKFFIRLILIAGLAYWAQLYFPFWVAAIVAFVIGLLLSEGKKKRAFSRSRKVSRPFSFWAGFLALFLLWGGLAFYIDHANASVLSTKLAQYILKASEGPMAGPWPMIAITALIGGLMGGFASLSGNLLGEAVKNS